MLLLAVFIDKAWVGRRLQIVWDVDDNSQLDKSVTRRIFNVFDLTLKVTSANSVDPDQSDLGPHCLPVCKNRFEKSARIFSRQHKQTTFSDAVFVGALRVKIK